MLLMTTGVRYHCGMGLLLLHSEMAEGVMVSKAPTTTSMEVTRRGQLFL